MKFFYTTKQCAIVLEHVTTVAVTDNDAREHTLSVYTADSPDPFRIVDKETAQRFAKETGFVFPDGHPWSLPAEAKAEPTPAGRTRRFTHRERFHDGSVYIEFFPDGRVETVLHTGARVKANHWTLAAAIENVQTGDWIELPVS